VQTISHDLMERALFDDDALIELAAELRPATVERIDGKLVVSPGTGGVTGRINSRLTRILDEYAESHGYASFDSSTGFHMPDHNTPSADHALVTFVRWEALSEQERMKLPPLVPDITVELLSERDRERKEITEKKCERWFTYGVAYVVLVDPFSQALSEWGTAPADFPDLRVLFNLK